MAGAIAFLSLWSHAIAALAFGCAGLVALRRGRHPALLVVALATSALWAVTVAGTAPGADAARLGESLRNLAWIGFMAALLRAGGGARPWGLTALYLAVAGVMVTNMAVTVMLSRAADLMVLPADAHRAAAALRMVSVTGALLLLHQLHGATGATRGPIHLAIWALAAMWVADFNLYALSWAQGVFAAPVAGLRGPVQLGVAAALLLAVHRGGEWRLVVSRQMTMRTLSAALLLAYLAAILIGTSLLGTLDGAAAGIAQAAFVLGASAGVLTLLPRGRVAGWLRVKVAKHLFQHRYDYRVEWSRFTETLGKPEHAAAPLPERVIKAVADIMLSPGGLLFTAEGDRMVAAATWNWPDGDVPDAALPGALGAYMLLGQRVIELDAARGDAAPDEELALLPQALLDASRAWVAVPLIHVDRLAGVVVLARPAAARALDWEDFDLLRVVGRQIASYLAERQGQRALDDARRFDEFNRRFAFVMHDVKNLVSQLTLVARNAERHADNPAFRADMVATLQDSAARMNALLARLSQHHGAVPDDPRPTPLAPLLSAIAARFAAQHPVRCGAVGAIVALVDPARLDKLIGHLVQNAIEASPPDAPVRIEAQASGGRAVIEVIDRGCGMTPEFIREKLFAPFASTKPEGFGIGAHEARQLATAMAGGIAVASRPGEGSRFTITLPLAAAPALEAAA